MPSISDDKTTVETTIGNHYYQDFEWKIHNFDKFSRDYLTKLGQRFGPTKVDNLRFQLIITWRFDHSPSTASFQIELCRLGCENWRYYPGKFKVEIKIEGSSHVNQFFMDFDCFHKHTFQISNCEIKANSTLLIAFEYHQNEIKRGIVQNDLATAEVSDEKSEFSTDESIEIVDSISELGSNEDASAYEMSKLEDLLKEERMKYLIVQERLEEREKRISELESIIKQIQSSTEHKNIPSLIEMKKIEAKLEDCGKTLDRIQSEINDPEKELIAMKALGKLMDKLKANIDEFGTVEYGADPACYSRLELHVLYDKVLTRLNYAIEITNQKVQNQQQKHIKKLIERATFKMGSLSPQELKEIQQKIQKKMAERSAEISDEKVSKKMAQLAQNANIAVEKLKTRLELFSEIDKLEGAINTEIQTIQILIAGCKRDHKTFRNLDILKDHQTNMESKKKHFLEVISNSKLSWNYQDLISKINECEKQLAEAVQELSIRIRHENEGSPDEVYY